ncbi:hypothetical protein CU097_005283 [Rhizopus azygosporus]|uniref:RNA-dependent RNA polymerase n=1 Tax=Rhizopus azygosporus TaxID=86630 RepID=A0A367K3G3_RHIAZ|nr:hypothetical protein G6F67_006764 [Rhizopus microsporus]KAG1264643.1 hypothetical protein G6F68_004177 [Rhizopus microsporus]RCH96679.1 hypothetical protein CU097_005283 [Rhizopus azygosporus]
MSLDPHLTRCAKQIYNHLGLTDRISQLQQPNVSYKEILLMKQLLSLSDHSLLDTIVTSFIKWNPPRQRKKTVNDFISQVSQEISGLLPEDIFEDIDDELFMNEPDQGKSNKRTSSEALDKVTPLTMVKKPKIDNTSPSTSRLNTPPPSPLDYFPAEATKSEEYNIIWSPTKSTKLFQGVSWIVIYEIARFMQACKIPWNEVPFDAFRSFIRIGMSEPRKLYEVMLRWNTETRLGQRLTGLAYSKMERCPDNVWSYIQTEKSSVTTQTTKEAMPFSPTSPPTSISINNENSFSQDSIKRKLLKNRMVRYSAVIQFKTTGTLPKINLRVPKITASNRLFRKFGQDRFLEMVLSESSQPSMVRMMKDFLLKPFLLMQRVFRFLFIKDSTLVFFATEGPDLEPISIQQVIDWHMPIIENWDMSMSKYASRMSLGYSSSIPTIQFDPSEIEYIDDIYSEIATVKDDAACMTDGCGIISCAAMKEIMGCQTTDELPCAIQGRIGGAKGIWILAPDMDFNSGKYIKIRKSQHKFKTGLPQPNCALDPHHYTFDLVKNSICIYPSNLNTQFIQVLAAGGVPTSVFVEILKEYIHRLATVVTENQNIKILRDWVTKTGSIMTRRWENEEQTEKCVWKDLSAEDDIENDMFHLDSDSADDDSKSDTSGSYTNKSHTNYLLSTKSYDSLNKYSGYPGNAFEAVVRLLDSGFDLTNAFVATRITTIFRQVMKSVNTKYRIEVPQSCTVTCVPDPTGLLKPDEVFLQLSTRRVDEKTGIRAGLVLGDVVITRNPCGLKSDVQKVKAVDCPALRMYTDIIIFPVTGDASLASKLGGGDYDGDLIFCCWDQRIVEPFQASPVIKELDRVTQAFQKDKSTLGQQIGAYPDPEKALQANFINVQMPDGTLGLYENWRTVLAEKSALDDPDVSYLAQMCARLVDAPKQGLHLKQSVYNRDRANFSKIPHPIWFMDKKNKQREGHKRAYKEANDCYTLLEQSPCVTTMDHLYKTLMTETAAFTKYSQCMFSEVDIPLKDHDLTGPWNRATELATGKNDSALQHDLELIRQAVNANMESYQKTMTEFHMLRQHIMDNIYDPNKYIENDAMDFTSPFASFFELEEFIAKEYHSTPDPSKFISPIFQFDVQVNGGYMLQNIKASYAYIICVSSRKYSKYCYVVAFDTLRRIKADALAKNNKENGLSETVSISIYPSLNMDRKWIRRIKESNVKSSNKSSSTDQITPRV